MAGSHSFVVASLLLCLVVLSQGVRHHEFCIPPTWFSDVEVQEIVGDPGNLQIISGQAEYYFDVSQKSFRADYHYPSQGLNISVLELFDLLLEIQWSAGVCEVNKLDPGAALDNCYDVEEDPKAFTIAGSLSSLAYSFATPGAATHVVVTQGTYIPILERARVDSDPPFSSLIEFYNLETSPHFDSTTFTPPSYCQVSAETSASLPRHMDVLHHVLPVPVRRFKEW